MNEEESGKDQKMRPLQEGGENVKKEEEEEETTFSEEHSAAVSGRSTSPRDLSRCRYHGEWGEEYLAPP